MSQSIFEIMATLPSGRILAPLTLDELGAYLRTNYKTQAEDEREARHRLRDDLYRDGGIDQMNALIDAVFVDKVVADKRKKWAKVARFNNITKRVVNELSTVYQETAVRSVDESQDANYQIALGLFEMNEAMRRVNRMLNLHRAVVVAPRVIKPMPDPKACIDIITPTNARLLLHPNDRQQIVGIATRVRYVTHAATIRKPEWHVWTATERFFMDREWSILSDTVEPHRFGRIPMSYVSLETGTENGPWPGTAGDDLPAADIAAWFAAVTLLKETKSATKQSIIAGDTALMARDQALDSELPVEIPDGTTVTTLDAGTELEQFLSVGNHILEAVANNYGMSGALIKHQGVQSAEARELMRVPLREMRREQHVTLRVFERDLAEVMSIVSTRELGVPFTTEGWRIDFGESQTPLSPKEELERFEQERRLGLTNTVDYMMSQNPDLDEEKAFELMERNVEIEVRRNRIMRPLVQINGSAASTIESGAPADSMSAKEDAAPSGDNGAADHTGE